MAANFIELQEDQSTDFVDPTKQEEDPTLTAAPAEPVDTAPEPVKDDIPEKYKGKSLDEIVKMHQEAEKLIGRQAQEVGEVRKLADSLLKQQLEPKHDTQPVKAQEIDWYEDPEKAVNQALEKNPILKQLQEQQAQQALLTARAEVEKVHPDFLTVVQSEDFINWVKQSKMRIQMVQQAENYDVDAALELLGNYKSLKNIQTQKADTTKAADDVLQKDNNEARTKALKTAAVQQGGTGESTKPIYRRADLIRLRMQDPVRYESMADDILQAYAEGRVR